MHRKEVGYRISDSLTIRFNIRLSLLHFLTCMRVAVTATLFSTGFPDGLRFFPPFSFQAFQAPASTLCIEARVDPLEVLLRECALLRNLSASSGRPLGLKIGDSRAFSKTVRLSKRMRHTPENIVYTRMNANKESDIRKPTVIILRPATCRCDV